MPQVMLARVTCPGCRNPFDTPVEQILDVRDDPSGKIRVLNGLVNVAACPHCGVRGALNLPFLYHDPDNELALLYMPLEAGRSDLERQQAIGKLTSTVMDSLPPEERKMYLLQPQIFLTLENLANKILEADGVTPEMIEQQRVRVELLQRMLDSTSDEVLEAMIKENNASIDAGFFRLLGVNLEIAQATGRAADMRQILAVRGKLLELSSEGQVVGARGEMVDFEKAGAMATGRLATVAVAGQNLATDSRRDRSRVALARSTDGSVTSHALTVGPSHGASVDLGLSTFRALVHMKLYGRAVPPGGLFP